jgi:hypothetical protein
VASVEELAAADPATDLGELARLAHEHPELRAVVAANPSTYEGLLEWLGQFGDPAVDAALARRRATEGPAVVTAAVPAVPASPDAPWHEPTRDLPLRWANYTLRYGIGLGVLLAAHVARVLVTGEGLDLGTAAVILLVGLAGIAVMPATIARRGIAAAIAVASMLAGLEWVLGGLVLVGTLAAWLLLRQRSGLAYLLLIPAGLLGVAGTMVFGPNLIGLVLQLGGLAGLAWLARLIHKRRPAQAPRASGRVEVRPGAQTNIIAVLALVFGIGGGLLGIILGHYARAQIRRTGDAGWGLATAGMVLGYVGLGTAIVVGVGYVVFVTSVVG